jgi:hypothetical protein
MAPCVAMSIQTTATKRRDFSRLSMLCRRNLRSNWATLD